jgi:hypothetical protein
VNPGDRRSNRSAYLRSGRIALVQRDDSMEDLLELQAF